MWIKFRGSDSRLIAHHTGILIIGVGLTMAVPLFTALAVAEWSAALDYVLGMGVTCSAGVALALVRTKERRFTRAHALVVAALSWLAASVVAAIPLALSGSYLSYLDAFFDAVSGITTSGLTLVNDLDHMALSHNMWRHLLHLIGGQGIIVAAISVAVGPRGGGGFLLYQAEARDERILPNVLNTARLIWFVTAVYLIAGTGAILMTNLALGMKPLLAFLEGFWMAVAAFDTGGFAPHAMNAMYYHSWVLEFVLMLLMIGGTMNFSLHVHVWRGDSRELLRNIEIRTLAINAAMLILFAAAGLAVTKAFAQPAAAILKGMFHVISAHSGTGHQVLYPGQWTTDFGGPALIAVILAMAAGGAVSSTAGGIKSLRLALIVKSVILRVKMSLAPVSAQVRGEYHHLRRRALSPEIMSLAMMTTLIYIVVYVGGGLIGAAYGYPITESLFESISACANVGLTAGLTHPSMPAGLKFVYIIQMWAGRLEFVAAFALIAHVIMAFRPRQGRAA